MNFQISALKQTPFTTLFSLSEDDLAHKKIIKVKVTEAGSTPCRVSLEDANIGETVLLLNYQHQSEETPFQSSHAIYVRQGVTQAHPDINVVPKTIHSRCVSLRAFDSQHMMLKADLAQGIQVAQKISEMLNDPSIEYLHLHYAKQGCFIAKAQRC